MSSGMNISNFAGYATQIAQIRATASRGNRGTSEHADAVTFREKRAKGSAERMRIDDDGNLDRISVTDAVHGAGTVRTITTAEMTMEEYKDYVRQRIDTLVQNRHPSQALRSVSINISEAGFEAMKDDPEYEKWVFDSLKANFDFNDPWASVCGGGYGFHNFGATKEEYRGQSWYAGYQKGHGGDVFDAKTEGSFYKHRVDTSAAEKKLQKYWEEKERNKAKQRQEDLKDLFFQRREMQEQIMQTWVDKQYGANVWR